MGKKCNSRFHEKLHLRYQCVIHCRCISICTSDYEKLQDSEGDWCSPGCEHSPLPFADCSRLSLGDDREKSIAQISLDSNTTSIAAATSVRGYYANCRSVLPKMDELYLVTSPSPPTIITLTETWLDSSISDSEVQLPCNRLFRRDRTRQGGDVALYVYKTVSIKATFSHPVAELLSVTVNNPTGSLLLTVVYRLPGLDGDLAVLDAALLSLQLLVLPMR